MQFKKYRVALISFRKIFLIIELVGIRKKNCALLKGFRTYEFLIFARKLMIKQANKKLEFSKACDDIWHIKI